jgi:hypothetical protein
MKTSDLRELTVLSLTRPAEAARILLAQNLQRETLWTALMLVAVLNTLMFSLSNVLMPGPSPLPQAFNSPAVYFFFVSGGLILIVMSIFWTGRALGGQGSMNDVLVMIVWLQGLRVLVQAAALILMMTIPILSALLVMAAAFIGIWILLHFVDQAHKFNSLGRSAGVLIAAFVAMVLGLSLILSLIGASILGSSGYV